MNKMNEQGLREAREVERQRIAQAERERRIIPRPAGWMKWQHRAANSARAEMWECTGIQAPRWKQDEEFTESLRQEVDELIPAASQDLLQPGTVYQSVDGGWSTPRMAVMTADGLQNFMPYSTAPFNSVVTCSDGTRRYIRRIGGVHSLVWAEPI